MTDPLTVKLAGQSLARGFADTGRLQGRSRAGEPQGKLPAVHKWLGIPYGTPERWDVVRYTPEWVGVRDCSEFSPRPVAGVEPLETLWDDMPGFDPRSFITVDEASSLTINVFKPGSTNLSAKLPVLVYHHGGGLNVGHSGVYLHDPTELIRYSEALSQPIIVVTFNYRLNIFGFLHHPDLASDTGISGNFGIHDQMAALEWVQKYIGRFGGDPDNVTCMGSSAGGFSLSLLFCRNTDNSPKRLFRKLVLQSGTIGTVAFRTSDYAHWDELLQHFHIDESTPSARLSALRAIHYTDLLEFAQSHRPAGGWGASLENGNGAVFDRLPLEALVEGRFDPEVEVVMMGNVADEGAMFGAVFKMDNPEMFKMMLSMLSPSQQETVARLYTSQTGNYDSRNSPFCQFMGDQMFNGPIANVTRILSSATNETTGRITPVQRYLFQGKLPDEITMSLGAFHTIDTLWMPGSAEDKTAKAIGKYWVDFVYAGSQAGPAVPEGGKLVFEGGGQISVESVARESQQAVREAFWMSVLNA